MPESEPTITALPTGIAGFVGLTALGDGAPLLVESQPAFEAAFGTTGTLAASARGFFVNGGEQLYVARADADTPDAFISAISQLSDIAEIALLAAPGVTDPAVVAALLVAAAPGTGRFALLDPPADADIAAVEAFRAGLDSRQAALFWPWLRDAAGALVPQSGFVAGVLAAADRARGAWKAPNAALAGTSGLAMATSEAASARLNPQNINVIREFSGRGRRLWGMRTLSSDPEARYITVQRQLIAMQAAIAAGLQPLLFEANTPLLWARVRSAITTYLRDQWRAGGLAGSSEKQAFFVTCDATTVSQFDIDSDRLKIIIGFAPLRPAEFVVFTMQLWVMGPG